MHNLKSSLPLLLLLLALSLCISSCHGGRRLRKKPKVYNALITTDDNLTSSRAYPVIQPTIHEPGYAPFGPYNPFGFYSPPLVRFGQPLVPGLPPNERLPYPLPTAPQYPPVYTSFDINQPSIVPAEEQPQPQPQPELAPQAPAQPEEAEPKELKTKEQLPLPLNERGLPPVLIPLSSQFSGQPMHLPPYPYHQYPLIYDQAGYVQQRENLLPPYDYYPSQGYPTRSPPAAAPAMQPAEPEVQPLPLDSLDATPSFDDIKNGSENKNSDVPDVPPPPIPSGPKRPRPKDN
ncbi:extensin [Drosophila novamexicana]|uniref:extensin n=1 Tax=Drosophila novamexicana TaxID=47314 RepID=UPI0011E5E1BA|nr:extensin [Drosophila novamexicana]